MGSYIMKLVGYMVFNGIPAYNGLFLEDKTVVHRGPYIRNAV